MDADTRMENLTPRQQTILKSLESYQRQHGTPPSRRELRVLTGLSFDTLQAELLRLATLGALRYASGRWRNYWSARLIDVA